jgi:hypothetical protein
MFHQHKHKMQRATKHKVSENISQLQTYLYKIYRIKNSHNGTKQVGFDDIIFWKVYKK